MAAAAAKLHQSCPTLCDPIDSSPPGSPNPGILQARTLERIAISFSNAWKWKVKVKSLSRVRLLATLWTAAYQAPLSMGFSRQEHWSGLPLTAAWGLHPVCHPFLYSPATENGLYLIFLILCPEFTFFKHFINLFGCTGSLLQHVGSLVVAHKLLVETWDLIPWPGIKSRAPCIESTES